MREFSPCNLNAGNFSHPSSVFHIRGCYASLSRQVVAQGPDAAGRALGVDRLYDRDDRASGGGPRRRARSSALSVETALSPCTHEPVLNESRRAGGTLLRRLLGAND